MATNWSDDQSEKPQPEALAGEPAIEAMTEDDLPRVAALERVCFSTPWSEKSFLLILRNPVAHSLVARFGERLVGYVVFGWNHEDFLVANLAVDPEVRGRGVGRRLMETACTIAAKSGADGVILDVRESNQSAFLLYRNLGFRVVGRRNAYYSDPEEDSLVMRMPLTPEGN